MRKTAKILIEDRGVQKKFLITELPATEAEDWALELFFVMANAGVEVPEDFEELGFAGIAQIGLQAFSKIPYEKAKPLLAKMMACVQIFPDLNDDRIVRQLLDSDIEDVQTRLKLRKEVFSLHTDFLKAVKQ